MHCYVGMYLNKLILASTPTIEATLFLFVDNRLLMVELFYHRDWVVRRRGDGRPPSPPGWVPLRPGPPCLRQFPAASPGGRAVPPLRRPHTLPAVVPVGAVTDT